MKNTTALMMALGLALPAMTFAQDSDQARPQRRERPAVRDAVPGEEANRRGLRDGDVPDVERPPGNREGRPGGQGQRPMIPPLMAALDANHDGVIDEDEIKNASEALRKLDKNGDGKITMEEVRPQRPGGPSGPEGAAPRGDRPGPPADGARPQRRNQHSPEGH
jgi:hypothetical protein